MKQHIGLIPLALFALLILTFAGCAEEQRIVLPEATLKGKITYKGKAVPYALVVVSAREGASTGNADAEGSYSIDHVYPGEVTIGVNTDAGKGNMMSATMAAAQGGDKSLKPTFVEIPAKYFDPKTSGITATIGQAGAKGVTTFDIVIN